MVSVLRWVEAGLAAWGFVAVCWVATGWAERAADWWCARKALTDEDAGLCPGCLDQRHCDGVMPNCDCTCTWPEDWAEEPLPPERTWEQMTSHQLPAVVPAPPGHWLNEPPDSERFLRGFWGEHYGQPGEPGWHEPERERRAPWWEAEQRQAYEALGLEFPSGLMARVREAAQ